MISSRLVPPLVWRRRRTRPSPRRLRRTSRLGQLRPQTRHAPRHGGRADDRARARHLRRRARLGARELGTDDLNRQVKSDYVVTATRGSNSGYFGSDHRTSARTVPGVTRSRPSTATRPRPRHHRLGLRHRRRDDRGVYRFAWKDGSNAAPRPPRRRRDRRLELRRASTTSQSAAPSGSRPRRHDCARSSCGRPTTRSSSPLFGGILVDQAAFDRDVLKPAEHLHTRQRPQRVEPRNDQALTHAVSAFTDVSVDTKAGLIEQQVDAIKRS